MEGEWNGGRRQEEGGGEGGEGGGKMEWRERKGTYEKISLWEWASEEAGVLDGLLESWGKGSWHFECGFA